jgi:hypothetical protein
MHRYSWICFVGQRISKKKRGTSLRKVLRDLIIAGINRNILVYDNRATRFSTRLVSLMKSYFWSRFEPEILERVYVPAPDVINTRYKDRYYTNIFGIKVIPVFDDLTTIYSTEGGDFLGNKIRIVIGISKKGKVLLGTY